MSIFTLIPSETKLSILLLVIFPAIAIGFLRFSLYAKLQEMNNRVSRSSRLLFERKEEGIQPAIVKRLRDRYKQASQELEHVHTIALIDSVYKDEIISYWGVKIQLDRAEGITRALPNLLIAFGLIGTFWGITNNLNNISGVLATLTPGSTELGEVLKQPLQDMGIAFLASLCGIFFGSMLTIINTIWNTSIVKYQLISGLEDYLDNIYKPTIEGNTRLDKAIDRMVQQQEDFLLRFHDNVGRVLETSFGKAADRIATECGRINQIAENVYTNFSNAAGTMATGAATFKQAANSLESQTKNLANSLDEFKIGTEKFQIAANQLEQNNIVQNLDRVLTELNTSQQAFTNSTKTLESSLEGITSSNKTAAELAEKVYQSLHTSIACMDNAASTIESSSNTFSNAVTSMESHAQTFAFFVPGIQKSAKTFETAIDKLEQNNIIQNLDRVLIELNTNQQAFASSTKTLESSLEEIASGNKTATQLAEKVYQGLHTSVACIDNAATTIDRSANTFANAATSIEIHTQIFADTIPDIQKGVETFEIAANKLEQNNIVQNLDLVLTGLNTTQTAFTHSTQILQSSLEGITSSNQTAAQLAQAVYKTWQASSTKIDTAAEMINDGAIIFQQVATSLQSQTQTLVELVPQLQTGISDFVSAADRVEGNNIIKNLDAVVANLSTTQQTFANSTQTLAMSVGEIVTGNHQATQIAQQIYQGLEHTTTNFQAGTNNFVTAAQIIRDSSLATELNTAAHVWQMAQTEFTQSTAIFSQSAQQIQPAIAKLEPGIAAIDRVVSSLQQFGAEVVHLSEDTLQMSASAKAAIVNFDRNYQQSLNSNDLSIQSIDKINHSNWQELRDILEHQIKSFGESSLKENRDLNRQLIETMKEYLTQISLRDREYFGRLMTTLDRLELRLNSDNIADISSN
jgi:exonuclease VII small subunit